MSIKAQVYNQKGEKVEDINLSDHIFGVEIKKDLVHQAATTQMGNQRQVLAHTKTRSEVRGGGRKPWRQKGTGRARAGTNRSPIWIGGGITFGPTKDRNFKKDINKKMKRKALFMALSDKLNNKNLVILDNLQVKEYKTKAMDQTLATIEKKIIKTDQASKRSLLIILPETEDKVAKSGRNLVGVKIINSDNINILDLLKYKNVIFTKSVVEKIEERYK